MYDVQKETMSQCEVLQELEKVKEQVRKMWNKRNRRAIIVTDERSEKISSR